MISVKMEVGLLLGHLLVMGRQQTLPMLENFEYTSLMEIIGILLGSKLLVHQGTGLESQWSSLMTPSVLLKATRIVLMLVKS